ncbi:hypothetical protein DWY25_13615 [Holdemania filiformis]|uniref:Glycosyltransferase subfamily 4-like N-terminal domain-containing protein n=1 Tax=Holdemania filiformis TaxID=61171 RepID=A0A412FS75_9FIRM|nr:hypothetical protein [Holdemania filiformis]RGR70977.1 hypothetical protein DWY25_13615 [Holdemania filiformis]
MSEIKKKYFPKILIISHNALSKTQNNGKTIETLFKEWPKEKIFHLFLDRDNDDSAFCSRSFCVNDYDALDNFFRLKKKRYACELRIEDNFIQPDKDYYKIIQKLINHNYKNDSKKSGKTIENLKQKVIQRKPFFSWLRQSLWNGKKWFMNDILLWVKDIKPDLIFFQGSGFHYSYDIVEQILDDTDLPIILQLTDDYTQPPYKYSLIDHYITNRYIKIFRRVIKRASGIVVISEKMKEEYLRKFGGQNYFIMSNALDRNFQDKELNVNGEINILYAGNLGLGRYEELIKFEQLLSGLIRKKGYKIVLKVCSSTILSEGKLDYFHDSKIIEWKGFLSSKEVEQLIEDCDFLLHVESTDEINKRITRLSISTKIGEYLGARRCIIALGPQDIASIEYIRNKKLGLVLSTNDTEKSICLLDQVIIDMCFRNVFIKNATVEFNTRYNQEYISNSIYEIVSQITEKKEESSN